MEGSTNAFNHGLHRAAVRGDDDGVRYALRLGADVNALDATGKTALICAIAGDNWQRLDPNDASFMTPERIAAIRALINHPKISLLTLNAPHNSMNGVVPLGMASWLNLPRVVQLLLEESADAISVDGMDSHGATALMYAARDGNLEVVQLLLSHGARPDFRDSNYRTSIQFALPHYQILWLCESVLRRHRWREFASADRPHFPISERILELTTHSLPSSDNLDPPPAFIFNTEATSRLLDTLVSSIRSDDLPFIHSLLFSPAISPSSPSSLYPMSAPVLVNLPDAKGWSLVHHALSVKFPSIDLLDSLYCAGADLALFTVNEQWTPLHILAQSQYLFSDDQTHANSLYELVVHLIRDLRAPLSARDKNDETCIHIAAEHGPSLELLACLLDMDKTGVRQLKNSRGLTAMQVAKPEFLPAFGPEAGILQLITTPLGSLSATSPSPNDSFASLSDLSEHLVSQDDSSSLCSPSSIDITLTAHQLLTCLRLSSPSGRHVNDPTELHRLEDAMADSRQHQEAIVQYFRDRVNEIEKELDHLKRTNERIGTLRSSVALSARTKSAFRGVRTIPPKRYHRESEDSTNTMVSYEELNGGSFSSEPSPIDEPQQPFDSVRTLKKSTLLGRSSVGTLAALFDRQQSITVGRVEVDSSFLDEDPSKSHRDSRLLSPISTPDLRHVKMDKKRRKQGEKLKELDSPDKKGASRLKAWFKRIVTSTSHQDLKDPQFSRSPALQPLDVLQGADHLPIQSGVFIRRPAISLSTSGQFIKPDSTIDCALQTSAVVLDAAQRDIRSIHACLASVQQFIDLAHHSITKVERATKRALKLRRAMIAKLRASEPGSLWRDGEVITPTSEPSGERFSPGLLGYSAAVSVRPSVASIHSLQSTHSSIASAAPTITENDDEDTRVIRRLVLRKIEAQMSGAWEDAERAATWLRVLKEVVRGVKRRAYL
ncbi:hypothetical protein DFP72DRAFT_119153 [Ephemerocybe angulata]|uniref:Ankyrin n=1 Tax=Ephemerocybe angulata TaxID=980116 RepID=A0A8H6M8K9_9AGAR|nr:hypothetical protein DFP72DRAFT_119153 [Tulosesus angulatus]